MIFSIAEQVLIALPLIMGAYVTLSLLKLPDFSLESAYLFGAVLAFVATEQPFPLVLLSAMGGGMLVGTLAGCLNQVLRIPFLLAAIVTNGLIHGLTQYVLGTSVVSFPYTWPIQEYVMLALIGACLVAVMGLILRTQMGYSLAIFGNNPQFFASHNMAGSYVLFFGVILGHGLAGISGFLFAQSNGFVDLNMNFGVILLCLAALMIGKLFIRMRRPNLWVPLLGLVGFYIIQHTLLRLGLNLKYFNAFQALFILGVLYLGQRKQRLCLDHLGV